MKVLIIEDEYPNAQRLQRLLGNLDSTIEIVGIQDSVAGTLAYLEQHKNIDLLFLDIQLTDGLGFEILDKMEQAIPVIITTAYDQYAITAFQYLSIDYLLKPIKEKDLQRSLDKYYNTFPQQTSFPIDQLVHYFTPRPTTKTIIGRRGKNRYPIQSDSIAYCFTEERSTWILTIDGKEYLIPTNLDQLEDTLSSNSFFRANRKTICSKKAVEKFEILAKSRIKLMLQPVPTFDIVISSDKSAAFKEWLCAC